MTEHVRVYGTVLDPHAAWLVQRGVRTLALRMRQQCATALALARMLEGHPQARALPYSYAGGPPAGARRAAPGQPAGLAAPAAREPAPRMHARRVASPIPDAALAGPLAYGRTCQEGCDKTNYSLLRVHGCSARRAGLPECSVQPGAPFSFFSDCVSGGRVAGRQVTKVHYPALPSSRDHERVAQLFGGAGGGVLAFEVRGGEAAADALLAVRAPSCWLAPALVRARQLARALPDARSEESLGVSADEAQPGRCGGACHAQV